MALVKELESFKPRFGSKVSISVQIQRWNHHFSITPYIEYQVSYLDNNTCVYQCISRNPKDLIYQVEKHLHNKEQMSVEITDVLI